MLFMLNCEVFTLYDIYITYHKIRIVSENNP